MASDDLLDCVETKLHNYFLCKPENTLSRILLVGHIIDGFP